MRERERERKRKQNSLREIIKRIDRIFLFSLLKKIRNCIHTFILRKAKKNNFYLEKKFTFKNISFFESNKNLISELCEIYGSDKGYLHLNNAKPFSSQPHSYSNFYYNMFNHCKDYIKLVFEVGIGTNNPNLPSTMGTNYKPGASLRVWKDYFFNAQIYGADVDKNILFNDEDRIHTYYVNQLNTNSIKEMWNNIKKKDFDIIIDDGLHTFEANINFFLNSFDKLKKNGIYIIEDVDYKNLNIINEKLKKFKPEIILLNSLQFKKPSFTSGFPRGVGENLIIFRK